MNLLYANFIHCGLLAHEHYPIRTFYITILTIRKFLSFKLHVCEQMLTNIGPVAESYLTRAPLGEGQILPLPTLLDFLDSSKRAADIDAKLYIIQHRLDVVSRNFIKILQFLRK